MGCGIIFLMGFPTEETKEGTLVLFLDDMAWRHSEFKRVTENLNGAMVTHAHTAAEAIERLSLVAFDQVFLDHDLSEEDVMVPVGEASRVPTGMSVVDHILTMDSPPQDVVIHSCNEPAARAMQQRLLLHHTGIKRVLRVPFPELLRRL